MSMQSQLGLKKKQWLLVLMSASIAGMVVALVMTALDWRLNPSGIFHQEHTTDWSVVMETAISWFVPVFLLVSAFTWIMVFLIGRSKKAF